MREDMGFVMFEAIETGKPHGLTTHAFAIEKQASLPLNVYPLSILRRHR
jgi:hypothetical protein